MPSQKRLFFDRLCCQLRVTARASEKQKLLYAKVEPSRNQIVLDLEILKQKFDGKIVIGLYTSHSSRRNYDRIGSGCRKKLPDISCVSQIQLITRPNDNISISMLLQIAKQRASDQTPVAGNIDGSKRHRTSLVQVIRSGVKLHRTVPSGYPMLKCIES